MLLKVEKLVKEYGKQRVVNEVSFGINPGEVVGLAGESGSGKSSVGRMILNLLQASSGSIQFGGVEWTKLAGQQKRNFRRKMQIVFQDPYSSLNPKWTIRQTLLEPLRLYNMPESPGVWLERVGLSSSYLERYPRELSGGQRQRIAIARALCTAPELLVCDEPLAALDKFTQYHILELFKAIHQRFKPAILFISHDLAALEQFTTRLMVMQKGVIVEEGLTREVLAQPQHPHTQRLVAAHRFFHSS